MEANGAAADLYPDMLQLEYRRVRRESEELCTPLEVEDYVVQTATEASPAKWHLAHVSWFFETFLLKPFKRDYHEYHPRFGELFNSYYDSVGAQWPRAQRGLLSRPTVAEVYAYRKHVDAALLALLTQHGEADWGELARRVQLGIAHEQQHQELLLTDLKQNFAHNPLSPAYRDDLPVAEGRDSPLRWVELTGGEVEIGHTGEDFAFDNERPRHRVLLDDFRLASRPVTKGEYLEFIEAGGYRQPEYWLSDGWQMVLAQGWRAPLYWRKFDGDWHEYTLGGLRPLVTAAPVCHVSYFEADAYARWAGRRLATEQEWERAATDVSVEGNLRGSGFLHPAPARPVTGVQQLFGDVWEWTASPYVPYPGYRREPGAFGEYNGKFMCNQLVARGGSCVSPDTHVRATYRNFFYPHDRWQFLGIRLAEAAA